MFGPQKRSELFFANAAPETAARFAKACMFEHFGEETGLRSCATCCRAALCALSLSSGAGKGLVMGVIGSLTGLPRIETISRQSDSGA